jgi:CheY-like chemotaxis protein
LIGNATKFTEYGHVLLEVQQEAQGAGCTMLHFRVTDTGIGIPADKYDTIFEAFRQADGSTTRQFGGTGLGLTISATLVKMMGGRIWVESEPGRGSTFHFTAGFDVTELAPIRPGPEPLLAELPVLVVDDNPVNRRILHAQLTRWQTRPTCVASGLQAFDAMQAAEDRSAPFNLILLDANMPGMDGFRVAEKILADPKFSGVTIMMLTSSGKYGDASRARDLGIAAYLTKPVDASALHDEICRVLERAEDTPRTESPRVGAAAGRGLRVLLAEDNIVNQRVAVGLLKKRGHDVIVANNGLEAIAELARQPVDLVLMDMQMPLMGGLEATAKIRESELISGGHVRIVAMTAHAMAGDRERCLEAGMDGYLSKPIDPTLFFAVVEQTDRSPDRQAAPAKAAAKAPAVAIDHESLMHRVGGDEQLVTEIALLFLADCPARVAAIQAAVEASDPDAIRLAAHALKGAAGNLSAVDLMAAARALERIGTEKRLDAAPAAFRELATQAVLAMDCLRTLVPMTMGAPS